MSTTNKFITFQLVKERELYLKADCEEFGHWWIINAVVVKNILKRGDGWTSNKLIKYW